MKKSGTNDNFASLVHSGRVRLTPYHQAGEQKV